VFAASGTWFGSLSSVVFPHLVQLNYWTQDLKLSGRLKVIKPSRTMDLDVSADVCIPTCIDHLTYHLSMMATGGSLLNIVLVPVIKASRKTGRYKRSKSVT
jgi:hypothetical protein